MSRKGYCEDRSRNFTSFTHPNDSFVREITVGPGGFRFIEVQQNSVDGGARGLLPTIPQPFFEGPSTTLNPDLQLSVKPPVTEGSGNIND